MLIAGSVQSTAHKSSVQSTAQKSYQMSGVKEIEPPLSGVKEIEPPLKLNGNYNSYPNNSFCSFEPIAINLSLTLTLTLWRFTLTHHHVGFNG